MESTVGPAPDFFFFFAYVLLLNACHLKPRTTEMLSVVEIAFLYIQLSTVTLKECQIQSSV